MKAAYFDCLSGASGNMILGAFLDAGVPLSAIEDGISALGVADHIRLSVDRRSKGALFGTHVDVEVLRSVSWSSVADIDALIANATRLDEGVRERSRLAFRLLAQAEARAHGVDVSRVALHETGAVDAVVDVVGSFVAAEYLQVEGFFCSALPYCVGMTRSAHGEIPLPAPATVAILEAVGAPTYRKDGEFELVTPTGAAILAACATFESPRLEREAEGYGAGSADLPWANVLRLVVGEVEVTPAGEPLVPEVDTEPVARETVAPGPVPAHGIVQETVSVIETNIDDMPANLLADVPRAMLEAGALEAYLTPVVMKKGRSAHLVTVVCDGTLVESLALKLLRETTTLGVRYREEQRLVAARRIEEFESTLGMVHVKVKELEGRPVDATPEFEDVRRLAEDSAIPLAEAHRQLHAEVRARFVKA